MTTPSEAVLLENQQRQQSRRPLPWHVEGINPDGEFNIFDSTGRLVAVVAVENPLNPREIEASRKRAEGICEWANGHQPAPATEPTGGGTSTQHTQEDLIRIIADLLRQRTPKFAAIIATLVSESLHYIPVDEANRLFKHETIPTHLQTALRQKYPWLLSERFQSIGEAAAATRSPQRTE